MTYEDYVTSEFETKKYVLLKDLLDRESCEQLTEELKNLVEQNQTTRDTQCPLSDSVHGSVTFDSLLEQLLPAFQVACGKRLYPTYAYARLYRPGEDLKVHTDRNACEISATVTLGFSGDVWKIYMADYADHSEPYAVEVKTEQGENKFVKNVSEISMDIGDTVLYRGMEKVHWRNPYVEGKWQAQVFLHYVDADGPNAEWKYDKRASLSHHAKPDNTYMALENAIPINACQKIISSCESQTSGYMAGIGSDDSNTIDTSIRNVKKVDLPSFKGIGATMVGIGLAANSDIWKFDVNKANQTDYLIYDVDGHYVKHIDTFILPGSTETRKLTILAFLNDDFEGGRLFLEVGDKKMYPPQKPGTVLIFPSFILHGVEPVTKGIRRSIVTWLVGPWFK